MSNNKKIRTEHIGYLLLGIAGLFLISRVYASTTIGTNVQSDGNYLLSGAGSAVVFSNGWQITQTSATTSQITVKDSAGNAALIFDEN
jgi:hypothetical protein